MDYIKDEGNKHGLLIDINTKHMCEDLPKKTKYQSSKLALHKSKVILQETILGLAELYSKFDKIYFPYPLPPTPLPPTPPTPYPPGVVRLDERGRMYCDSGYLN